MAKTSKKTGQAAGAAPSQPPPPNVAENEPHLEFEEEELDSKTLRAMLGVLQDELANLRAKSGECCGDNGAVAKRNRMPAPRAE